MLSINAGGAKAEPKQPSPNRIEMRRFKGTVSRNFRPLVFFVNNTPGAHKSRAKPELNVNYYSRRLSTTKIDSAQCRMSHICGNISANSQPYEKMNNEKII
jgi:hypothetical protein